MALHFEFFIGDCVHCHEYQPFLIVSRYTRWKSVALRWSHCTLIETQRGLASLSGNQRIDINEGSFEKSVD